VYDREVGTKVFQVVGGSPANIGEQYWPAEDTAGKVTSVFSRTGAVTAQPNDYAASQVANDSSVAGANVKLALQALQGSIVPAPVTAVFGRVNAIVAAFADYTTSLIANASLVGGVTSSDALNNLLGAINSLAANIAALNSTQIANVSTVAGAEVTDALNSLLTAINALTSTQVTNASGVSGAKVTDALNSLNAGIVSNPLIPYLIAPASPNAFDDEFTSGSPDLATRGYTVLSGSTTLTRSGNIDPWNATGPAAGTYWSTLIGSWIFVQGAPGVQIDICKTISLSAGDTYFCRTVGTYNLATIAAARFCEVGFYGFAGGALDNNNRVFSTVRDDPASSWMVYDVARLTAGVGGGPTGKSGYGPRDIRGVRFNSGTTHNAFLIDGQTGEPRTAELTGTPAAATLVRFALRNAFSNSGSNTPQIWGIDFIRKKTANAWLIP
jgi:hypothetical protein